MRCLYCGKEISETASQQEKLHEWHKRCVYKFFGKRDMPVIAIDEDKLEALANDAVNKGLTIPGVQKKLSLHLSDEPESRLTIVDYPAGYILKPQTDLYEMLPELEHLTMNMARMAGINTVEYALVKSCGEYAYITKRIDRLSEAVGGKYMLAMEDFCQLSERLTMDKYKGSYEKCSRIIREYSKQPGLDMSELFIRIVFSFITGNSDMHLKNFSLIETSPGLREFYLSPAYDMLPVNIVLPDDKEQMALTLCGKKSNFKKRDFIMFAIACGIPESAAEKMIGRLCKLGSKFISECNNSKLSRELKRELIELIEERIHILST